MTRATRVLGVVLLLAAGSAAPGQAQQGRAPTGLRADPPTMAAAGETVPLRNAWTWGVSSGYGLGVDISSDASFLGDVRFVGVLPWVGWERESTSFPNRWYRGRLGMTAEAAVLPSHRPLRGVGGGVSLNGRYRAETGRPWAPFASLGAGPMVLDFNNRYQADGLNFILQAGGGLEWRVTPSLALLAEVRMHHISNAGLRRPNPGINDVLFLVGFARPLR